MNDSEEWREFDRAARKTGLRAGIWIIAIILFIGALGVMGFMWKTATSEVKGQGEQVQMVNDAQNRTQAQQYFVEQFQLIQSTDAKLDGMLAAVNGTSNPDQRDILMQAFTGTKSRCLDMIAQYNAAAQKVTMAKWRDPAMPFSIDTTDPKTDCKETIN